VTLDAKRRRKHEATARKCASLPEPVSYRDLYEWGFALLALDRCAEACSILERALEQYPEAEARNEVFLYLGQARHGLAEYGRAADALRSSIAISPASPSSHAALGDALRMAGARTEAEAAYRAALARALGGEDAAVQALAGLKALGVRR
jgi:tetratricopeptide (TPR) repeat protein